MSLLRAQLNAVAATFVNSVLQIIQHSPLDELLAEMGTGTPAKAGAEHAPTGQAIEQTGGKKRRARASAAQVQNQKDLALKTAKSLSGGFAKKDVMKKSGSKVDLGRALSLLVDEGKLTKKGDRRLARYWVK